MTQFLTRSKTRFHEFVNCLQFVFCCIVFSLVVVEYITHIFSNVDVQLFGKQRFINGEKDINLKALN